MYTNNAYLNDSHIDRKDKSNPLIVTMCGTYKLYTKPKLPTWRPRGRVDFQLLYVASGKAHFYFDEDGTDTIVHAGHMVLYRPKRTSKICLLCQGSHRSILGSLYWKQCHKSTSFLWHNQR